MINWFESSLKFVLAREGGKCDDPLDRGGRTNMGITQRVYDSWRFDKGLTKRDVWLMPEEEAATIYKELYWDAVRGDDLPHPLDLILFDSAVQHGAREAAIFVHGALGVEEADAIGPLTLQQIARVDPTELAVEVVTERVDFYRHLIAVDPDQKRFEAGWGNRIALLCETAGLQDPGEV